MQRDSIVRILRPESYWFQEIGTIVYIDKSNRKTPIVVRFDRVNLAGDNISNFSLDELLEIAPPINQAPQELL
ncbi:photosystem I reaction center subunit IV [Pseudanabaena sp. FACHB-1998]|uniref:photosystem I reaction center subunit IV n=1 Tax=Pseudanabaena sp. FACHB-1998 TaxID=2692858 RepID=UPI001680DE13|nr:photosystem I reaction center subunit IV [Pseudanabaena sp. FACHB-1998]MBD2176571.1 photosystem I reaction center subunit IV [Pseudanabaena sp. FACHB-1998]